LQADYDAPAAALLLTTKKKSHTQSRFRDSLRLRQSRPRWMADPMFRIVGADGLLWALLMTVDSLATVP
jgi:hypothetical protein